MQPLKKIVSFESSGAIRKSTVYYDGLHNLYRVVYNRDCQPDVFMDQKQAESAACKFVN